MPIYNELKCLKAGLHTILEISRFNKNIVVVATKLFKQKGDIGHNWLDFADFKNIKKFIMTKINFDIPVLPLKFSKVFDLIFEQERSIKHLQNSNPLAHYTYREVSQQFDKIYSVIDSYNAK